MPMSKVPVPKTVIVAALEREVALLIKKWTRVPREHEGRKFIFFEREDTALVCGGIGLQAARRATEASIALYQPTLVKSAGFAGGLDPTLRVGDIFWPSLLLDARDGSRISLEGRDGTLVTFMEVAGAAQKSKLAQAYAARAVDMEAAAVAASANAHGIAFTAIKVISDELDFEIPGMSAFIDNDGEFHTLNFALFLALRPWLWLRIALLTRNSGKAARALSACLQSGRKAYAAVTQSVSSTIPPSERSK
jgi:adenosylhomocysteine nucleosidase